MRFMVMVKGDPPADFTGPGEEILAAMGKYNEELARAGVLLAAEGLHPSARGAARVHFSGARRTVTDGPFTEAKELVAGFWIFQVNSREEAIDWVKRAPNPFPGDSEIEIRQIFELADIGPAFTPELQQAEERLRTQLQKG